MRTILTSLFLLFLIQHSEAQIVVGGNTFGSCEQLDAGISNESIAVTASEVHLDLRRDEDGDIPKSLMVILSVEKYPGIPFPIQPEDKVSLSLSDTQFGLAEHRHQEEQLAKLDQGKMKSEQAQMNQQKGSIEEESQRIAQEMMEGKISPEEAAAKIEALTSGILSAVESSEAATFEYQEMEERPVYGLTFYNTASWEEYTMVDGSVTIERFNESTFKASFSGRWVVRCMERKAASSREAEMECSAFESTLLPGAKVLSEVQMSGSLQFKPIRFQNNR